jgi:dihydrodipicolinate synthase/N-acetylneuraminate lyase
MYSFVPTPWTEDGTVDHDVLQRDVSYLASTPVHGLYTPDTSGEFFELEFDAFCDVVDTVLDAAGETPVQIGCHWTNADGALDRASYAASAGADAIRFSFPYWEPPDVDESIAFVESLASAAGDTPLVHYNVSRSGTVFGVDEYRRLVDHVPTLVGTKLDLHDTTAIARIVRRVDDLSHFVSEYTFAQGIAAGAEGCYSWLATTNPALAVEWYDASSSGDWDRAMAIQRQVDRWSVERLDRWDFASTAARTKLDARLNPNIECPLRVRAPFESGPVTDLEWAQEWAADHWPELIPQPVPES